MKRGIRFLLPALVLCLALGVYADRTAITPTEVTIDGVAQPTATTGIADGHKFLNPDQNVFLLVEQTSGGALTITIPSPASLEDGQDVPDIVVACTSGTLYMIGPFRNAYYLQSDGYVHIDYESGSESEFSVMVFELPKIN